MTTVEEDKVNQDNSNLENKPDTQQRQTTKKEEDKDNGVDNTSNQTLDTQNYVPKKQFESVSKNLSEKDKKLSQLEKEMIKMKNREAVKDMLLESELPEIIKSSIKSNIDQVTPDNFTEVASHYNNIYESGKNSYKNEQAQRITKKPMKAEDITFNKQLEGAKSQDDLRKAFEALR